MVQAAQRNALVLIALVFLSAGLHTFARQELIEYARAATYSATVLPLHTVTWPTSKKHTGQASSATSSKDAPPLLATLLGSTSPPPPEPSVTAASAASTGVEASRSAAAATSRTSTASGLSSNEARKGLLRGAGCRRRFRLLVWNVQQKDARRASDVLTRSVLKFAAAKGFDAVALNEVFHDEQALLALSAPLGYAHASLHRGRLGSRLGLISTVPLRVQPVRHMLGHGALCARPIPPGSRTDGGGGGSAAEEGDHDAPPIVCVAHLGQTEAARLAELPSILGALPSKQPALLVGDLNALSPLDFGGNGSRSATSAMTVLLSQMAASRKLKKKYLNATSQPAVRVVGALHKAGLVDLAHLAAVAAQSPRNGGESRTEPTWRANAARNLPTPDEEGRLRIAPSPPPPPPDSATVAGAATGVSATHGTAPELRIDYALANAALFAGCMSPPDGMPFTAGSPSSSPAGWGVWASAVPLADLASHGVTSVSEHSPLQVIIGEGGPPGASLAGYELALAEQKAAASAAAALPPLAATLASTPRTKASLDGGGGRSSSSMPRPYLPSKEIDPAYRIGGAGHALTDGEIAAMPGGLPSSTPRGGAGADAAACDALGMAGAKNLAHLKSEVESGGEGGFVKRCQALSGMLKLLGLRRRLKTCAVVGGSGILRQHPRGAEIDAHEAILRVNNCPVGGFEALVGSRTSVRFLNGPRSIIWGRQIAQQTTAKKIPPPELTKNDHVVVWGDAGTLDRLKSALPRNASVVRANTRFRRECADRTFWSADELDSHRASNGVPRLEITFGFEAVAHALYACERVNIYGFFLSHEDAKRQTNAAATGGGKPMDVPYHYYENQTYDKSAKDPWRPWTYRFHNFELEHSKFRQLQSACWLDVVTS